MGLYYVQVHTSNVHDMVFTNIIHEYIRVYTSNVGDFTNIM